MRFRMRNDAVEQAGSQKHLWARALHKSRLVRHKQSGMTLIELMIVVAIVAVLASVAVSMFTKTTRRARSSEVPAMMAEFKIRQAQFYSENGTYVSTGDSDTDIYPLLSGNPDEPTPLTSPPETWTDKLRLQPDRDALHCGYVSIAGSPNDGTIGTVAQSFGMSERPPVDWFYVIAECDFDGDTGTNSLYMARGDKDGLAKQNEGR